MTALSRRRRLVDRIYPVVVIAAAASLLITQRPAGLAQPLPLAALLVCAVVMATFTLRLPIGDRQTTVAVLSFTDVVALLLLGPYEAMLVAGTGAGAQCLLLGRTRPPLRRGLFAAAASMIAVYAAAKATAAVGGFGYGAPLLTLGAATVVGALVLSAVNGGLRAIAVAVARREQAPATYTELLWSAPACLVGTAAAVVLVHGASTYLWAAVLAAGPAYLTLTAYRLYTGRLEEQQQHLKEISDLHLASVEALARAIDARDQTIDQAGGGEHHIRRVQAWATGLARAAGMSRPEVEAIRIASLLHDIGKLAVPEHILSKPGPLTSKERARVRIHPVVGAEIIKAVPFPYPVASFIRSHHERWDGTGYPDGLRGDAIPLGARVLAIVDFFDAVSSPRPYHVAATRAEAIAALQAESGRYLDPTLVRQFIALLPAVDAVIPPPPEAAPALRTDAAQATPHAPAAPAWAFQNISLATQEMRALHDIAQTLGTRLSVDDTMALLTAKLNRLVPASAWVLLLYDETAEVLRGRFATGLAAETLRTLCIPMGAGASGWAARHRGAAVNARAFTDFAAAGVAITDPPLQAALSSPLVHGDRLIGVLTAYHVERAPFTDGHQHVLDQVAPQAASVLENAVAYEQLRDASETDVLTELPNMRALTGALEARLAAGRDGGGHALIMVDVDDFKSVNDTHGHAAGDAVLRAVGAVIRAQVRDADVCARYGGDEFVLALEGCDRLEAERRSRELQRAVEATPFEIDGAPGRRLHVTISVGVAVSPDDGESLADLMAAADQRMYADKAARRRFVRGRGAA